MRSLVRRDTGEDYEQYLSLKQYYPYRFTFP